MSWRNCWIALISCVLFQLAGFAMGQAPEVITESATGPPPAESLTVAEIESRRIQAEESKDLNDDTKKKVAELYRQALEQLNRAENLKRQAAEFKTASENVAQRVGEIRAGLEEFQRRKPESVDSLALTELEQKLAAKNLRFTELKNSQAKIDAEPAARANRRRETRGFLLEVPQKLEEVKRQLETAPPADEPIHVKLARTTELLSRRILLEQEFLARRHELAKYDAEDAADLIRLERDFLAEEISFAKKEADLVGESVRRKREEEAQAALVRAQEDAIRAHPLLKPYAEENQKLAEEAQSLTEKIAVAEQSLAQVKQRLEGVQRSFEQTKQKVENVGLTGPIGLMLRKQRADLPNVRRRWQNIDQRQPVIDDAQFALFDYDDKRSSLAQLEPHIDNVLAEARTQSDETKQKRVKDAARIVLEKQREYLDRVIRSYSTYFDTLVDLDTSERQLIHVAEEFQNYIDERVLWIRSAKPLFKEFHPEQSDVELMQVERWQAVGLKLWGDMRTKPGVYALGLLLLIVLLYVGRRLRREIAEIGETASRSTCHEFLPTLRAALLTLIVAVPWPGVFVFLGWRLSPLANGDELARGLAYGCWATAWAYLVMELTRQVCRTDGLAESHFDWPGSVSAGLRQHVRWMMILGLPLVMLTSTLQAADPEHGRDVVERIGFLLAAIVVAVFLRRVLSPAAGILREYLAYHPGGWTDRLKYVWSAAGAVAPLALGVLSVMGYHYTARHLGFRLFITLSLILSLIVLRAFLLRLILMVHRRLSIAEWRRRRAETAQVSSEPAKVSTLSPQQLIGQAEQRMDFRTHSQQSSRLVTTFTVAASLIGLWLIWSDVVPALGFLDRWPLWTTTVTVTEQSSAADGSNPVIMATRERIENITLADLGLAITIAVVTVVAARNVPGLLEISLLQRLPLENSVRYAITSLAGYAIVMVGVIIGCGVIGLRWSQIQWLATALTFGLAFGLQEMFANFIAGLILLFERPIRVGDVVTVDDTTGVVSRIRIRATTITNWDRKEFVVPNKEFITGKLLNWTLTDNVNRIVITVGVAYGSDTEKARDLMLSVAGEHSAILKDPPPVATFEGFGESCLNITLRAFLPNLENRLATIHDLHTAIDRAFQEAGIDIAFPQRDLHIRTVAQLPIVSQLQRKGKDNSAAA